MDYQQWIERQRRFRLKALAQSPQVRDRGGYRICADCGEVCLCHESACPNCGGREIAWGSLPGGLGEAAGRVRCRRRFDELASGQGE